MVKKFQFASYPNRKDTIIRKILFHIASQLCLAATASALEPSVGHLEIVPRYSLSQNNWTWETDWLTDDLVSRNDRVETLFFPGFDTTSSQLGGIRFTRNTDSRWNFLGSSAGSPVWIYRSGSYTYPGISTQQLDIFENITIFLDRVDEPTGGHFSMYFGSTPTVYMQTLDGISAADRYVKTNDHSHVQWAFSKTGLWIVWIKAQGTFASNGTQTPLSQAVPLVFAIGNFAQWKAAQFTAQELADATFTGDNADTDGDDWSTLMEYALGGDPKVASAHRAVDSLPLAPLLLPPLGSETLWRYCYYRRSNSTELNYQVESSSSLAPDTWRTENIIPTILLISDDWQQVCVPLSSSPTSSNATFFRLKVSTTP